MIYFFWTWKICRVYPLFALRILMLGTPRETIRLVKIEGKWVCDRKCYGKDYTEELTTISKELIKKILCNMVDICGFIFKSKSPLVELSRSNSTLWKTTLLNHMLQQQEWWQRWLWSIIRRYLLRITTDWLIRGLGKILWCSFLPILILEFKKEASKK